jgi:hypothetical protein
LEARVPDNANPALDITTPYSESPLSTSCTNGEVIQLRVYVHNGADAAYNNNGTGPSVAHGVQVQVNIPSTQSTTFDPNATISATNATSVSDDLVLDCTGGQAVELQYVPGSASQYSVATNAFTTLPDTIVTTGTSIQSESVAGDVWACWNDRVIAILLVKVVIPTTPPVITTPPPAPKVLVNTGPGNVVGIFFGISLLAGVGYFLRGRYLVRK